MTTPVSHTEGLGTSSRGLVEARRCHRPRRGIPEHSCPAAAVGLLLIEAHGEWLDADRRNLSVGSIALIHPTDPTHRTPPIALPTRTEEVTDTPVSLRHS